VKFLFTLLLFAFLSFNFSFVSVATNTTDVKQKERFNTFCDLHEKYIEIKVQKGSLFNMDVAQRQHIENLANQETEIAVQAQNILKLVDGTTYELLGEEIVLDLNKSGIQTPQSAPTKAPKTDNAKIVVFPNPSNGQLNFTITNTNKEALFLVNIYDLSGRFLMQEKLNATTTSINMSNLSKGVYIYEVKSDAERIKTGKIILE